MGSAFQALVVGTRITSTPAGDCLSHSTNPWARSGANFPGQAIGAEKLEFLLGLWRVLDKSPSLEPGYSCQHASIVQGNLFIRFLSFPWHGPRLFQASQMSPS